MNAAKIGPGFQTSDVSVSGSIDQGHPRYEH